MQLVADDEHKQHTHEDISIREKCFVVITNHSIDINDTHTLPADPVWMSTIDRAQPGTV